MWLEKSMMRNDLLVCVLKKYKRSQRYYRNPNCRSICLNWVKTLYFDARETRETLMPFDRVGSDLEFKERASV